MAAQHLIARLADGCGIGVVAIVDRQIGVAAPDRQRHAVEQGGQPVALVGEGQRLLHAVAGVVQPQHVTGEGAAAAAAEPAQPSIGVLQAQLEAEFAVAMAKRGHRVGSHRPVGLDEPAVEIRQAGNALGGAEQLAEIADEAGLAFAPDDRGRRRLRQQRLGPGQPLALPRGLSFDRAQPAMAIPGQAAEPGRGGSEQDKAGDQARHVGRRCLVRPSMTATGVPRFSPPRPHRGNLGATGAPDKPAAGSRDGCSDARRWRQEAPGPSSTISMRRLAARPAAVPFGATGWVSPRPLAEMMLGSTPCDTR